MSGRMTAIVSRVGWRRLRVVIAVVLLTSSAAVALGQGGGQGRLPRLPEGLAVPPKFPPAAIQDASFRVCKIIYTSVRREVNGMGWSTDWPFAGRHLMTRVSELTRTPISRDDAGEPSHWTVPLMDDALFQCPFATASDVGTLHFSEPERIQMREYFLKGGFLWVDDFWGQAAWNQWASEIHAVLPEFPIFDIPRSHAIHHLLYDVPELPQIPGINFWQVTGGATSERGLDSAQANFRAIADTNGRIMVLMSHNADVQDSWERESEDPAYFAQFAAEGYALGTNVVIYSLTH